MYDTAEKLGSSLGNAALETSAAIQENAGIAQVCADNLTEEIHSAAHDVKRLMRMRYDAYMAFRGDRRELRLLKAFPGMHPDTGKDIIKELRDMSVGNWVNSVIENIRIKLRAESVGELIGHGEDDD